MKRLIPIALLVLAAASLLGGCSSKEIDINTEADNVAKLYAKARRNMGGGQFQLAARYFDELETRYPFSPYALQARLDIAYTYALHGIPEEAVSEAEKFIRFNPTHEFVDYAYYIRGVANFGQKKKFLGSWFKQDSADFEQSPMVEAYNDFSYILQNFPNSKYAADARQRMVFLRNTFARHEIHVAQYYVSKKAWVAAANRANYILQSLSETPESREALAILMQSYQALGLTKAAKDAEKILRLNYPDHPLLQKS